ncbi:uroporphyrinogen decarboxylase [Loigolactobacillus backii]|uniref:Uroporphyrinogen decarboxylase n=2 Tax=Loigolactobacillus backii TaxID=375175 RepID=A0A192H1I1_9LACO|nr:uroporphyrinogen decarboxylase family protein [Loigolactobacillus backii]ANK60338.1 uroporphyrinogen decarboxylase [Loigolactobacillus backii]ANK62220.1 uroporphyrinogen decarboxylase [Loigolactobacillus backii]ANK65219.1 uroporphyrinogen decarboxylase [Loigolactobacillus backii]ANK67777.1 uroporphyrinogen decarboxylase [Loigolactobacillus backii]ANK70765.1 uroporphyrinogen decarboxylase [Loigolactobacillus backii]
MVDLKKNVLRAFANEEEEKVPVSFWRHFAKSEFTDAATHPEIVDINVKGHESYIKKVSPDFIKFMTDGYFIYPFLNVKDVRQLTSLEHLKSLPKDHSWFKEQASLAKRQVKIANDQFTFYTIFSPLTILKWALIDHAKEPLTLADKRFADLYSEDPRALKKILTIIGTDLKELVKVVLNAGIDGIYYSTQSIQDSRTDNLDFFNDIQRVIDHDVIKTINERADFNVLHICGFDGATNHLEWYRDYQLQIINWSTHSDGYSLAEGKKLFGDRPVLGGFGIEKTDVLYSGSKAEIQAAAKELVNEVGKKGVIIGADCTIQRDIPYEHLIWAIEAVHSV